MKAILYGLWLAFKEGAKLGLQGKGHLAFMAGMISGAEEARKAGKL